MKKFYSTLKIICIAALVISLIALIAVIAYVLINGVGKLSVGLLLGNNSASPTILPALVGTLELVGIASVMPFQSVLRAQYSL